MDSSLLSSTGFIKNDSKNDDLTNSMILAVQKRLPATLGTLRNQTSSTTIPSLELATKNLASLYPMYPGTSIQVTLKSDGNRYDKLKHAAEEIMKEQITSRTERDISSAKLSSLESTLQSQASKIQRLRSDKSQLQSLLEMEKGTISKLEFEIKSLHTMISSLKSQITHLQETIQSAKNDENILSHKIEDYYSRMDKLMAQFEEVKKRYTSCTEENLHLTEKLQASEAASSISISTLELSNREKTAEILELRSFNSDISKKLSELSFEHEKGLQELASKILELSACKEALITLKKDFSDLNENCNKLNAEFIATKSELEEQQELKIGLETQKLKLEESLSESMNQVATLQESLELLKTDLSECKDSLEASKVELKNSTVTFETEISHRIEEQKKSKDQHELEKIMLQEQWNTKENNFHSEIAELALQIDKLNVKLKTATSTNESLQAELSTSKAELKLLQQEVARFRQEKADAGSNYSSELAEVKRQMLDRLKEKEDSLKAKEREISSINKELASRQAEIAMKNQEINEKNVQILDNLNEIQKHKLSISQKEAEINASMNDSKQDKKGILEQYQSLQRKYDELESHARCKEKERQELENEYKKTLGQFEESLKTIEELKTRQREMLNAASKKSPEQLHETPKRTQASTKIANNSIKNASTHKNVEPSISDLSPTSRFCLSQTSNKKYKVETEKSIHKTTKPIAKEEDAKYDKDNNDDDCTDDLGSSLVEETLEMPSSPTLAPTTHSLAKATAPMRKSQQVVQGESPAVNGSKSGIKWGSKSRSSALVPGTMSLQTPPKSSTPSTPMSIPSAYSNKISPTGDIQRTPPTSKQAVTSKKFTKSASPKDAQPIKKTKISCKTNSNSGKAFDSMFDADNDPFAFK